MSNPDLDLSAELFLEHEQFVHQVARGLLRDDAAAHDAVQDTWLVALRAGPRALGSLRGWLGRVTTNRARQMQRADSRRAARERRAARPEALESVADASARLSVQRDVVAKVLELREPYRSVVILRYYHELSADEIATRLGSKPATVRTQLVRAHELLRARLDAEYRDRAAWAALLVTESNSAGVGAAVLVAAALLVSIGALAWIVAPEERSQPASESLAASSGEEQHALEGTASTTSAAPAARDDDATQRSRIDPAPSDEIVYDVAELFDRSNYHDYELATFSFERGLRDDVHGVLRNDWDLEFSAGWFDAITVVSDHSVLVDLGVSRLDELASADLVSLEALVVAAARVQQADVGHTSERDVRSPVRQGHSYFLWTLDDDSDVASAFEVLHHEPGRRCVLEWYSTNDGRNARCSRRDVSTGRSLMATLMRLREVAREQHPLRAPRVVMSVRAAFGGGNPHRIDLAGQPTRYVDVLTDRALDVLAPFEPGEPSKAYSSGGFLRADQIFVVTRASLYASAAGNTNGHGEARVELSGERIYHARDRAEAERFEWNGRAEIRPGEEHRTYLEVANSSLAELVLEGHFESCPAPTLAEREVIGRNEPRAWDPARGPRCAWHHMQRLRLVDGARSSGEPPSPQRLSSAPVRSIDLALANGLLSVDGADSGERALTDLGTHSLARLRGASREERSAFIESVAAHWSDGWPASTSAPAVVGHLYAVLSREGERITVAMCEVLAIDAEGTCELEWLALRNEFSVLSSIEIAAGERSLADVLLELQRRALLAEALREPRVVLQLRAGAVGGNPVGIDMLGQVGTYVDELSSSALDTTSAVGIHEPARAYFEGGPLAAGQVFVITRIRCRGSAHGDSNGGGQVSVVLGSEAVVDIGTTDEPIDVEWRGRFEVRAGEERGVRLSISNSSAAQAVFEGHFEDPERR
ncbi:MAG: sigma-70 family RNA polymerase sigma factor [Planctomycetes bacterium]|nr:sigma-70 family RNA polymerase sigma factor [Planctomycetota bacterium]